MRGILSLVLLGALAACVADPTPEEAGGALVQVIDGAASTITEGEADRLGCLIALFQRTNMSAILARYREHAARTAYPEDADFVAWHIGFRAGRRGGALADAACGMGGE